MTGLLDLPTRACDVVEGPHANASTRPPEEPVAQNPR